MKKKKLVSRVSKVSIKKTKNAVTNYGMYTENVMDHFMHPHNLGEIKDADAIGEAGNPVCGDMMFLYLKIKDNKIKDIKFKTLGCAAAIATSSMITDMAKGKTIDQALKITNKDVAEKLGGLPAIKMHCSVLAQQALKNAIENYYKKHPK